MNGTLHLEVLGTSIDLTYDDPIPASFVAHQRNVWADLRRVPERPAARRLRLTIGPGTSSPETVRATSLERLAELTTTRVTMEAMRSRAGEVLLLHAAGLALPDGRVVAFIGRSGVGKSTLAQRLGRRYGYVSDETIAVTPDGRVLPYRKPLAIITGHATKTLIAPSTAGMLPLPAAPLRLSAVTLLARRPDAPDEPGVGMVRPADGITGLLANSSYAASQRRPLRSLARILEATGGVQLLSYRDADDLDGVVERLVTATRQASPAPSIQASAWVASKHSAGTGAPPSPRYRRAPVADWLDLGDVVLCLRGHTLERLTGIGPAVWRAIEQPMPLHAVTAAVIDAHGVPDCGQPELLVADALEALVERRLALSATY